MGSKYANIVQTCLTCLDMGNEDFGDESEFQDRDVVLIAVRYIEKVSCHVSFRGKAADVLRLFCSSATSLYESN